MRGDAVRVILPAAGRQRRWGDDNPKQMVEIDGEPLLHRTVRQLRERGVSDLHLVVINPRIKAPGVQRFEPEHHRRRDGQADRFMNSRHLWSKTGRTLLLYTDVWFSDEAMDSIFDAPREWLAFARPYASEVTGKNHGELFGHGFWPEHIPEHLAALERIIDLRKRGVITKTLGWQHYRAMIGCPDHKLQSANRNHRERMVLLDDRTDDFDSPDDLRVWLERRDGG